MKIAKNHSLITAAAVAVAAGLAADASAQVVVDGSITTGEYGPAIAVQDSPTGFGDNFSELNAAYADYVSGTGLYLGLTGNLELNGNGLVVFIDSKPGGAIASTDSSGFGTIGSIGGAKSDDWGTDRDGTINQEDPINPPSILDPGFNPDYSLEINGFNGQYFLNVIDLTLPNDADPNVDRFIGQTDDLGTPFTGTYEIDDGNGGTTPIGDITFAFDNSNVDGVIATNDDNVLGDPLTAVTGLEYLLTDEFLMTALNTSGDIKLLPFITNGGGDFLSNQFLPGLGGVDNLGGNGDPGGVPLFDASVFTGDQFISIDIGGASPLPGDANGDGTVDLADFGILRANFGSTSGTFMTGDFNGDGNVDLADFGILRANFGTSSGSDIAALDAWYSTVVPEPTTLALAGLGGLALLRRRRN
ncbi:MAG: dockerin type I domain-containing protein [Planctomycetota bacterium]